MTTSVRDNLASVRDRVRMAELAAGRAPGSVRILLATKTLPASTVREALAADVDLRRGDDAAGAGPALPVLIGENRVQEVVAKAPEIHADLAAHRSALHLIGPLQSNKVNSALRWVQAVQSVATLELAHRLSARLASAEARDVAVRRDGDGALEIWVQVNVSGEGSKNGAAPGDAVELAQSVAMLPGLRLAGLMTIGANSPDEVEVREGYRLLRTLRDAVTASDVPGTHDATGLSMGMSRDLEWAIAEGATLVRVGSAVFGRRLT